MVARSVSPRLSRRFAAVLLLLGGLLSGLVVAAPAQAAVPGGDLVGTLTLSDAAHNPEDYVVYLYPTFPMDQLSWPRTIPEPDGTYAFTNVPVGDYLLRFEPIGDLEWIYPDYYYPGSVSVVGAQFVTVTQGETTTVDFAPPVGGFVEVEVGFDGTSTDPGIQFYLYDQTGSVAIYGPLGAPVRFLDSGTGGWTPEHPVATLGPLQAGSYRVGALAASAEAGFGGASVWATTYWNKTTNLKHASVFAVEPGETSDADVSLFFEKLPSGGINGRVVDASGNAVVGAFVGAESTTGDINQLGRWAVRTDENGQYKLPYLLPGDYTVFAYTVEMYVETITDYEYYSEQDTYESATLVTVTDSVQYDISFSLGENNPALREDQLMKAQHKMLPPASETADLLSLLDSRGIPVEPLSEWGATDEIPVEESTVIDDVEWTSDDTIVDLFGYSTATYLGSFAVGAGQTDVVIPAETLPVGSHHVLLVGRDTGDMRAAEVDVIAGDGEGPALAATGTEVSPWPLAVVGLLVLAGATVMASARRRRA